MTLAAGSVALVAVPAHGAVGGVHEAVMNHPCCHPPPSYQDPVFYHPAFPVNDVHVTQDADEEIQKAAKFALAAPHGARIVIYADAHGTPHHHGGLAERRAVAIANRLVGYGVNAGSIDVRWQREGHHRGPSIAVKQLAHPFE